MNIFETKYLIDSDAGSRIKRELLETDFFDKHCYLTEENIFELRLDHKINIFEKNMIKIDKEILSNLPNVWAKVELGDKVFNYYQNEGNGDLIIMATLLSEIEKGKTHLFNDDWVIVTDDKGLSELARKFSFVIMTSSEFAKILEESITVAEGGLINDDGF